MAEKLTFDVVARASGAGDVQRLGDAIDRVGKAADDLDRKRSAGGFFKKLGDDADGAGKRAVSSLGGAFSKIASGALDMGQKAGSALMSGISSALEGFGPGGAAVGGGLFVAAIAAAPVAGALIAGGLIAGIAAAGIGGGIALALQDPEIKQAASTLGTSIVDRLKDAAEPFKGALLSTFTEVGQAFNRSFGDIERTFRNLAPLVAPFAAEVGKGINDLTKGIADLSTQAGPVMQALGEGVRLVSQVIGEGFSKLGDDGPAAAIAIQIAFESVSNVLTVVFGLLDKLVEAFGWIAEKGLLGPRIKADYEEFKNKVAGVKNELKATGDEARSTTSAMQGLSDQLKAQSDPAFALITAQQQLTTAQKAYNDAVRQYGADSAQATAASNDLAKAALGMQKAAEDAGTGFNGTMTPAMRAALEAANLTEPQIRAIKKSMRDAAQAGKDYGKTYAAKIELQGLGGVQAAAGAAKRAIDAIPSTKTITINTISVGGLATRAMGGIDMKMAAGGTVTSHFVRSPTVLYGERGDEAYIARGAPKQRSRSIVEQVAEKWLGGRVSWDAGGQGRGRAAAASAPTGATSDAALLGELRALRAAFERGAPVYLDGRRVDAVQGRAADLYARAG